jgi:hypothetical protein
MRRQRKSNKRRPKSLLKSILQDFNVNFISNWPTIIITMDLLKQKLRWAFSQAQPMKNHQFLDIWLTAASLLAAHLRPPTQSRRHPPGHRRRLPSQSPLVEVCRPCNRCRLPAQNPPPDACRLGSPLPSRENWEPVFPMLGHMGMGSVTPWGAVWSHSVTCTWSWSCFRYSITLFGWAYQHGLSAVE